VNTGAVANSYEGGINMASVTTPEPTMRELECFSPEARGYVKQLRAESAQRRVELRRLMKEINELAQGD
jgi:hypothetical protein